MALAQQHQQGTIFARMMLCLVRELFTIYQRAGGSPKMSFNDLLVVMAIYAEADRARPQVTYPQIEKATGIARSSIERITEVLLPTGMIIKLEARRGISFISNPAYINNPDWLDHSLRVRECILDAALELQKVWLL